MPSIKLNKAIFEKLVGKKLPIDELKDRISMLGTDLESIEGNEISVEVFPNRPDMLSEQGFARAFSSFIGIKTGLKEYKVKKSDYTLTVDKSLKDVRPHTACAVVKNIKFDNEKIKEIIQIQEKLHITYGRNRKKFAIGMYPMEKITFPITFKAVEPDKIKFQPLEYDKEITSRQILSKHPKGRDFAHLMKDLNKFAIFIDANNNILSMPPIINSHNIGKINEKTKEVFIEVSGNDLETQQICLNILVTALADMGGELYSIEINHFKLGTIITPNLEPRKMKLDLKYANKLLGMKFKETEAIELLSKMGFGYKNKFILVPAYRADILHQIDLVEDIAIAYGYENFKEELPSFSTIGKESPFEIFKKRISYILTGLGLIECYTYHLTSRENQESLMNTKMNLISLANANSAEYNVLRQWIIPCLMEVLTNNKHNEYPQNIFDIGTIFKKGKSETGTIENDRLAILLCEEKANFTKIKQILDYIFRMLNIEYDIKQVDHTSFIEGRVGRISIKNKNIGYIGEIHPKVIENFDLDLPVAGLELNLTEIFKLK